MGIEFSNGFTITKNTLNDNIPGVGEWFFYSDEGNINAGPPENNGNAIFITEGTPNIETFNPNASSGTDYIYFNPLDATGADYFNDFQQLVDAGGTLTLNQNGDTAIFNTVGSIGGFEMLPISTYWIFRVKLSVATQTKSSNAPYVYADPISLTFGA
jgi:hypothetical protein